MTEEEKKIDEPSVSDEQIEHASNASDSDAGVEIEEIELTEEEKKDKKIKNLISAVILLAGLFVGSLFVDVMQMVRGGGFSQHALSSAEVFSSAGKTWVSFSEPIVKVQVISDDKCEDCKPDDVLIGLKQALPTMQNEKIDINSAAGKKLIAQFDLKTIPAFIFSKEIEKTELFAKAEPFLDKKDDGYAIKSAEAGFPVGKYISAPSISDKDILIGSSDANVKVVAFVNFQSPTDKKAYNDIIAPTLKDYADKIQLVVKPYVPATAIQGASAALGAACANEQGKFIAYVEKLFASQDAWSKAKDAVPTLKIYAQQIGLKTADFNKCLDDKKFADQIAANLKDGQAFGLQGTPSIFVGTDLQTPAVKYDDIKKTLDEQLTK